MEGLEAGSIMHSLSSLMVTPHLMMVTTRPIDLVIVRNWIIGTINVGTHHLFQFVLTWPTFSIFSICIGSLKSTHNSYYVFVLAIGLGLQILLPIIRTEQPLLSRILADFVMLSTKGVK